MMVSNGNTHSALKHNHDDGEWVSQLDFPLHLLYYRFDMLYEEIPSKILGFKGFYTKGIDYTDDKNTSRTPNGPRETPINTWGILLSLFLPNWCEPPSPSYNGPSCHHYSIRYLQLQSKKKDIFLMGGGARRDKLETVGCLLSYGLDIKALLQTYLPKSLSQTAKYINLRGWGNNKTEHLRAPSGACLKMDTRFSKLEYFGKRKKKRKKVFF